MAAIDKYYVKSYFELDDLRKWALVYYPKLLLYFYDGTLTIDYLQFGEWQESAARHYTKITGKKVSVSDFDFAVMNTPMRVDKILKWICPLPGIRKYLQNQCGVKEHWYYKLFWKGKKHFI